MLMRLDPLAAPDAAATYGRGPDPEVSLVIGPGGSAHDLAATLEALQAIPAGPRWEIIVPMVRTAATPGDALVRLLLDTIPSLRPVPVETTTVAGVFNRGAAVARSQTLVFLARGTRLGRGDLDAVLRDLRTGPSAAVSLARPGGEGRRVLTAAELLPRAEAMRPAVLATTRPVWETVGGFDEDRTGAAFPDWLLRVHGAGLWVVGRGLSAVMPADRARGGGVLPAATWDALWADALSRDPSLAVLRPAAFAAHRRALAVETRRQGGLHRDALALWGRALAADPGGALRDPAGCLHALARCFGPADRAGR
ncbi:hypothetical protein [Roseospira navarrensis]|uniref:Glycosyltransferase n=1 Tax=Roseospira navarrensis TaxID=140058 RepID=A0A7X1ZG21_9PROT|nr:hypothetical protein [Roseospira navarrensis]MQX37668.1 hypothetical protein [Roseospira navarrensis]